MMGLRNGARATARAGTASGNGLSDADVSIGLRNDNKPSKFYCIWCIAVDHNQSESHLNYFIRNAPMSGFIIS